MEESQFDHMWAEIKKETLNREKGSFKRALWYGGRGNAFSGFLGDGKGLRKTIRNSPKTFFMKVLPSAAVSIGLAPVAPAAAPAVAKGAQIGVKIGVLAAKTIIGKLIPEILNNANKRLIKKKAYRGGAIIEKKKEKWDSSKESEWEFNLRKAKIKHESEHSRQGGLKDRLQNSWAHKKMFKNEHEAFAKEIREKIKNDVKDLEKDNGFLVIDRNLVKLKNAKNKIEPSVKKANELVRFDKNTFDQLDDDFYKHQEERMDAFEDALHAVIETEYYITKISGISDGIASTLSDVMDKLKELKKEVDDVQSDAKEYIIWSFLDL